jgi:hypothetical protein
MSFFISYWFRIVPSFSICENRFARIPQKVLSEYDEII